MQRAREIARLRTTLVGAEQPDDIPEGESRRSRYRTRSSSRTKSRGTSRETRSYSSNRLITSSDDDEEERPYDRAYVRRSRSRLRSRSRGKSRPKSRGAGDQKQAKDLGVKTKAAENAEEKDSKTEELDNGSYEECTFDGFCWVCHRTVDKAELNCVTCERRFHPDCVGRGGAEPLAWSCPECALELASDQAENRSWAMRQISVTQLGTLLKFAVKEMQQRVKSSEIFAEPVSLKTHPSYRRFVLRPMDLSELNARIDSLSYGSPAGFLADTKYIFHNSVVFNGNGSGITRIARQMLRICATQMDEIETCPECYLRAHTQEDWFTGVCPSPHLLVWAKSGRYPFWPAKVIKMRGNETDCRFFGAHEKALIPSNLVYLFSSNPPTGPLRSSGLLAEAIEECHTYISNLQKRHGLFCLAPNRTQLVPGKMSEHLAMQLPNLPLQPANEGKKDTTPIKREQKASGTNPERPDNKPSPCKEVPQKLPADSEMSDLQRLDALHRDFLETEATLEVDDDSSNEEASSWHPTSPSAAKKTPSPPVSPLAAKNSPTTASPTSDRLTSKEPMSPTVLLTDLNLTNASPTDSKGPVIRTVDIKTLMPESVASPSQPCIGQPLVVQQVVNQSTNESKYVLKSPVSDRMILVASSTANQFVTVSRPASTVTYTLQPATGTSVPGQVQGARPVALATSGGKYVSVLPAPGKAGVDLGRLVYPVLQPKPVAVTTVQTFKTVAAKSVTTTVPVLTSLPTVQLVATNPVAAAKSGVVQGAKKLEASLVTVVNPTVATSFQTVRMVPTNSPACREVISVSNSKTLSVISNMKTVASAAFKNISAVTTATLKPITATAVQTTKATAVPNLVSTVTLTTVSGNFPLVSSRASPSPVTLVPSQPRDRGVSAEPVGVDDSTSGSKSVGSESMASLSTKVPTPAILKNVDTEEVSIALAPTPPATSETSKKEASKEIPNKGKTEVLTLMPMKAATIERPKKSVPTEASKKLSRFPLLAARKTFVRPRSDEMPEFESVFLQEPMDTKATPPRNAVSVYAGKKPVPGSASNGIPKMVYLSSGTEPSLKRSSSSNTAGEYTIMSQAEYDRKRKRTRFASFDPSRPLTLVEHPPPGVRATPLPMGASAQASRTASPISRPLPTSNLRKIVPSPSVAAPISNKSSVTARKTISGTGITIASRPKIVPATVEIVETTPKSSVSSEQSPVDRSLAELGAKAFADFYERFLDRAASEGHAEAQLKKKQLELDRTRWRMQEQLNEQRSTYLLQLNERAASFRNQLSAQAAEVARMQREMDHLKADFKTRLVEAKKKQWCAACLREAKFHCCWNTSYCAEPCQLAHWTKHIAVCKNRQVRRNHRISQPTRTTLVIPKEVVREEGELDPEATAAMKAALDNATRVIEAVANADNTDAGNTNSVTEVQIFIGSPEQSETSTDVPSQSLETSDLPNASQEIADLTDGAQPATDVDEQAQCSTDSLKQAQSSTDSVKPSQASTGSIKESQASTDTVEQSQLSTDSVVQVQPFTDSEKQLQPSTDPVEKPQPSTDSLQQSQPATEARDLSQSGAESDSLEGEGPDLYMECVAEGSDSNVGNLSPTSSLGSVRVVSVRSLGDDHTLWKQRDLERQ